VTDRILRNAIRTPDGTVLESYFRHDYQTHVDKNGKTYMVDGGRVYLRRSANGDEEDLSVHMSDPHEKRRDAFKWGTYGPNADQPLKFVALKDLADDHIQAILDTQKQIKDKYIEELLRAEQEYRRGKA